MPVLEVFFDYACPYCLEAHEALTGMIHEFPEVEIAWRPCEAHPRPDPYGPHSDLCIQGMLFAADEGADLWDYHAILYRAALRDRINIEDIQVLAACVDGLLDRERFAQALTEGRFQAEQQALNRYAFQQSGVWAVPAYRMEGRRLGAVEDVGVTRRQLKDFLGGR